MAVTREYFRLLIPEFSTIESLSDERLDAYLAAAKLEVPRSRWGTKADRGIVLLAAHMAKRLTLVTPEGNAAINGEVKSQKVGDLQVTFSSVSDFSQIVKSSIDTTPYGMEYERLRSQVGYSPLIIV